MRDNDGMKVETQFLVRLVKVPDGWTAECSPAGILTGPHKTRHEALGAAREVATEFVQGDAQAWLHQWQRDMNVVTCPEGTIKLPIDLWYCKITRNPCPIQAQVPIDDLGIFLDGCDASPTRAESIFRTVQSGLYSGAHHVPGRYLCVGCRRRRGGPLIRYRYPWELQLASDLVLGTDLDHATMRRALILSDLPVAFMYTAVCPNCALNAVAAVAPGTRSELEIVNLEMETDSRVRADP